MITDTSKQQQKKTTEDPAEKIKCLHIVFLGNIEAFNIVSRWFKDDQKVGREVLKHTIC